MRKVVTEWAWETIYDRGGCLNGDTFLLYTLETGGLFKVQKCSEERYGEIVRAGEINITPPDMDAPPKMAPVKFVALLRVEQNHDFVLGRSR